jgi:dihydroorotate dehydrogenase
MGWYAGVARPAFFALPPEAAHRVALALLSLPIPWKRVGGALDLPALQTTLGGIPVRNPIGLAAGFDKSMGHLDALGSLGFGYLVGGTVTRAPRRGNEKPRIVRDRSRASMVNSMGLPNPGAAAVAASLAGAPRSAPRIASIADEEIDAASAAVALLDPVVDGFELNASSPNAGWAHREAHVAALLDELASTTGKPIFVKLPPFETDDQREHVLSMAVSARDRGAAGLTCSNTRPVEEPRLRTGKGGLSGRALFGSTPAIVREVRAATGAAIPIAACGGIGSAGDVIACLEAGASTVQLYTALIYQGPGIVGALTRGLADRLLADGIGVADLVGAAADGA